MPTYSFNCEKCSHDTEVFTSMKNKPDFVSCEKCGQPAHAQLSTPNFTINGYNAKNNYGATDKSRRR